MSWYLALFFVLVLVWFYLATPAIASTYSANNTSQNSQEFIQKCLFSQPESGVEEVACGVAKTVAEAGIVVAACYVADAIATVPFPPAAVLAPMCNALGLTMAGKKVVAPSKK